MEKKILTIMVALMLVAAIVVAFVMIAAGGTRTAGGFTKLFNELENPNPNDTYDQVLRLPSDWAVDDTKVVSDTIVDMYLLNTYTYQTSTIYVYELYFVYIDDKWTDPAEGTSFYVPMSVGNNDFLRVHHGQFHMSVSSPSDLALTYEIGDVIELETKLVSDDGRLSFGSWSLTSD